MGAFLESLSGYKTYGFMLAWVAFEILLARHLVTLDAETANQIRVGLLGAAGLSFRHGTQKAEDAAKGVT